jgi:hypothetical protein
MNVRVAMTRDRMRGLLKREWDWGRKKKNNEWQSGALPFSP